MSKVIAVDMDGTLAEEYWNEGKEKYDCGKLGKPIPKMIERVRRWLERGDEVLVFTARVCPETHGFDELNEAREAIRKFCLEHFGKELEITCIKNGRVKEFWDDKAVRVERGTGELEVYVEESEEDGIGGFLSK